jgi:MoxR-like ATPase
VNQAREVERLATEFRNDLRQLELEIGKVIVGQDELIRSVLLGLLAKGHILLEGTPGLGKTLLVKTISECLDLEFGRIQFTPDLMPADILGTNMIVERSGGSKNYELLKGPIFSNILMADEINRAIPKTQAALLEAMQERQVTIFRQLHQLKEPFLVLATQNPIELEGTYPLPEAQLDRFLFKVNVERPSRQAMNQILEQTTGVYEPKVRKLMSSERILQMQDLIRQVEVSNTCRDFVVNLVEATHPNSPIAPEVVKRYVRYGASPRGAQAILLSAKVRALSDGRYAVSNDDIKYVSHAALRHRLILSFEGEAEGIRADQILDALLKSISEKSDG